ncbi:glutamate-rich protein 1 isoform X3 [Lithobates pipiens]
MCAARREGLESERRDIGQNECNRSVDGELNLGNSIVPVNNEKEFMHYQKIYTVSLPPDDYVPGPQNNDGSSTTENSDLYEDVEAAWNCMPLLILSSTRTPRSFFILDSPRSSPHNNQPVKRRKRRRQQKKENAASHSAPDSRNHQKPTEDQTLKSEGCFINKNKKRKLQRKRQKERLKAAGLWPKMKSVELTNQLETGMVDTVEQSIAQSEEELKKTEDLLDFLQATQEIYFTECKSPCADSALSTELVLEIITQIKYGAVPFSELCLLHQLKSLLLLQDIERLKDSLDSFKEHSSMPVGHRLALHSLFCYWISDILPMKLKATS